MMKVDARPAVIIYAPGLSQGEANTGDRIAEVLAHAIDSQSADLTCSTKSDAEVAAPKGLKVAKTIVDGNDKPLFQVFELDYRSRLDSSTGALALPIPTGIVESTKYMIRGLWRVVKASRRPAKSGLAKWQLILGYVPGLALIFAWLVAAYALLSATGLTEIEVLSGWLGPVPASWSVGITGVFVISWTVARKKILALAESTQRILDYTENRGRNRETVTMSLDDAVAGLRDGGWKGDIHLIGYSFGSLVLFDAMFPDKNSLKVAAPLGDISTMVTVGFPIDMVRLYCPGYERKVDRIERTPMLKWTNIFNAADVFGSNMSDYNDFVETSTITDGGKPSQPILATDFDGYDVTSLRYSDEQLDILQVLKAEGFKAHGGYWGNVTEGHCFEQVVQMWRPLLAEDIAQRPMLPGPD